jgi:cytoskeletal protein CcmA (bactofilin family)
MFVEISPPTFIAEGTRLHGNLAFISGTQVFGQVEGDIAHESLEPLHVGKTGWVHGTITATGPVLVEGRVDGDIRSLTRVRLLPSAVVRGSIVAPSVEIRAGARFEGELAMSLSRHRKLEKAA